jgi:hypothetical protein
VIRYQESEQPVDDEDRRSGHDLIAKFNWFPQSKYQALENRNEALSCELDSIRVQQRYNQSGFSYD